MLIDTVEGQRPPHRVTDGIDELAASIASHEQFMQTIGCVPKIVQSSNRRRTKQFAAESGVYTIPPRGEIQDDLVAGKVKVVRITDPVAD